MIRLLVCGFEPFGSYRENSSWDAARSLGQTPAAGPAGAGRPDVEFRPVRLPVDFRATPETLRRELETHVPDAVLLLGLRGDTPFLDLEQIALNQGAEGNSEQYFALTGGAAALESPVELGPVVDKIRASGVPARLSVHAGAYLCNAAFYHALEWSSGTSPRAPVALVHLPLLPSQAAAHYETTGEALPSLAHEQVIVGLGHVVDSLASFCGSSPAGD